MYRIVCICMITGQTHFVSEPTQMQPQMAKAMHRGGTPIGLCCIILFIHMLQHRAELGYDLSNRTLLPVFAHRSIFFDRF
jgi:hypothetical protein